MPDFGFTLTLEPAVALEGRLGFRLGFALGLEPFVRHLAERPRRGSGAFVGLALFGRIDALGEQAPCFGFEFARHRQRNHWVRPERDRLWLAGEAVGQPPELGTLRHYVQLKSLAVALLIGFWLGFEVTDGRVCQCHGWLPG